MADLRGPEGLHGGGIVTGVRYRGSNEKRENGIMCGCLTGEGRERNEPPREESTVSMKGKMEAWMSPRLLHYREARGGTSPATSFPLPSCKRSLRIPTFPVKLERT